MPKGMGFHDGIKMLLAALSHEENPYYKVHGPLYKAFGIFSSVFFAIHYGGFHLGYFFFLAVFSKWDFFGIAENIDFIGIIFVSMLFFANHAFSFWKHELVNKEGANRSPMAMFAAPYIRIIPMHLTIIFGAFFIMFLPGIGKKISLVFFLLLKTLTDTSSHVKMHTQNK